jgi:hypothetical protein
MKTRTAYLFVSASYVYLGIATNEALLGLMIVKPMAAHLTYWILALIYLAMSSD